MLLQTLLVTVQAMNSVKMSLLALPYVVQISLIVDCFFCTGSFYSFVSADLVAEAPYLWSIV